MALSNLTAVPTIADKSQATPGLWNVPFGILEKNLLQVQSDFSPSDSSVIGWNKGSIATTLDTSGGTFSTLTIRPASGNTITIAATAILRAGATVGAGTFGPGALLQANDGTEILRVVADPSYSGGLRRHVGTPLDGGRVYILDELWVEDDLWADESIQITSSEVYVTTTLATPASVNDAFITVLDARSFGTDQYVSLGTAGLGLGLDRARITGISSGSRLDLDSNLNYAHASGSLVTQALWRGSIFPINAASLPGGNLILGAFQVPSAASSNPVSINLNQPHTKYVTGWMPYLGDMVDGAAVTAQSPTDMTVAVASGRIFSNHDNAYVQFGAQTAVLAASPSTLTRIDLVSIDADGGVAVVSVGTPAVGPSTPSLPTGNVSLASILVRPSASSITAGDITNTRIHAIDLRSPDAANFGVRLGDGTNYLGFRNVGTEIRQIDVGGGTYPTVRINQPLGVPDGSSATPGHFFSSEISLGLYRSGVSTIAPSYGTLNLATNAVRFSMRTQAASQSSLNMSVDEVAFSILGASGASLAIRSGGTIWIFDSSRSTKG